MKAAGVGILLCAGFLAAQNPGSSPTAQVVVTAEPRHGHDTPALSAKDVLVFSRKDRSGNGQLPVVELIPAAGGHAPLELMVLLDDGAGTDIGNQLDDIRKFIRALPADASVSLGYMKNGSAGLVQKMTRDHEAAAAKIRLPLGTPGINGSPYFALEDAIKHWQRNPQTRREVLMVTDGIDRYYGSGPGNGYVDALLERAQREAIVVHSIFWSGAGHDSHRYWAIQWGQNYLAQLAEGTGGEAYWQGYRNPVSLGPYLDQLLERFSNQYLLTFQTAPRSKPELIPIQIRTELAGVEIVGPMKALAP